MSQQHINTDIPNSGNGDALRDAFVKTEDNFTDLYGNKVDKISGKDLSSNDFTTAEKNKLAGIPADAEKNVQADFLTNDPDDDSYIKNKPTFITGVAWGDIIGTLSAQTDLQNALDSLPTFEYVDSKISQTVNSGITDFSPSEDAVFNALTTKTPTTRTISINGVVQDLTADRQYRAGLSNTGALTYAGISSVSSTAVSIGAVTGIISDNETNPNIPSFTLINFSGVTNVTVPTLGGGTGTYVLLSKGVVTGGVGAGALVFQNTFPTSAQRKTMIYLSKISHPNLSTISFAIDEVDFVTSPLQQYRDFSQAIGYMNQGIFATPNASLTINTTNGNIIGDGINFVVDRTNPNMISVAAGAPRNFLLLNQSGATGSFITTIDPDNYDVNGVTTAIGGTNTRSTIQYLFYAPGVGFAIQRGQTVYATLPDAIAAVGKESFVLRPNLVNNSILIAAICLRRTTSDMTDINFCKILTADKFGQIGGASAGISVTSLQTAYNNSLVPQITTIAGAVTLKEGGAGNAENVLAIQNLAGNATFNIDGNGKITGNSFVKSGATSTNILLAGGTDIPQSTFEPAFAKNTAFNKNFGTAAGTVAEGNDIRILNGQTAFGWGNHATAGYAFSNGSNATGTWNISILGNAGTVTNGVYTTGSYANPTWITSLDWGKVINTPTTLAGYGITDSAPSSGSGSYIQNQNASAQSANMWISGAGRFGENQVGTAVRLYNPNLSAGQNISLAVGTSETINNSGFLVWQHETATTDRFLSLETFSNANPIRFGGSKFLFTGGNVGIGTTNPQSKLDVNGDIRISNNANFLQFTPTSGLAGIGSVGSSALNFYVGSGLETRMSILQNGNVGIGTTNPTQRLEVSGSILAKSSGSTSIKVESTGGGVASLQIQDPTGGNIIFRADGGNSYISNGNVGIGTINPFLPLSIEKALDGAQLRVRNIGTASQSAGIQFSIADSSVTTDNYVKAGIFFKGDGSGTGLGDFQFAIRNVVDNSNVSSSDALMTIKKNGNILIGITTDNGYKLNVNGTGYFSSNIIVGSTSSYGGTIQSLINQDGSTHWTIDNQNSGSSAHAALTLATYGATWNIETGSQASNNNNLEFVINPYSGRVPMMTLTSGGRLLLGTTDNGVDVLQVYGTGYIQNQLVLDGVAGVNSGMLFKGTAAGATNFVIGNGVFGVSNGGFGFRDVTNGANRLGISPTGAVQINSLADGSTTRTVVAQADGTLSTIPTVTGIQVIIVEGGWSFNNSCVVATGLLAGRTILDIRSSLKCTAAFGGYNLGDIASISETQPVDSGGLDDSGITVRYRSDDPTKFTFVINNRLDLGVPHNGGAGTCANTGNPIQVDNVHFNVRHVIMYI